MFLLTTAACFAATWLSWGTTKPELPTIGTPFAQTLQEIVRATDTMHKTIETKRTETQSRLQVRLLAMVTDIQTAVSGYETACTQVERTRVDSEGLAHTRYCTDLASIFSERRTLEDQQMQLMRALSTSQEKERTLRESYLSGLNTGYKQAQDQQREKQKELLKNVGQIVSSHIPILEGREAKYVVEERTTLASAYATLKTTVETALKQLEDNCRKTEEAQRNWEAITAEIPKSEGPVKAQTSDETVQALGNEASTKTPQRPADTNPRKTANKQ